MNTLRLALPILPFVVVHAVCSAAGLVTSTMPSSQINSGGGSSFRPLMSADGRRVVFVSHANNLVTNDNRLEYFDIFVRDLSSSNTVLVSVKDSGTGGAGGNSTAGGISSNGQFVVFASEADDLVSGDTNAASDIFGRDLSLGITRLVSADLSGSAPADPDPTSIIPLSGNPVISTDGRWVFFESRAANLTAVPDTNGTTDVFARNSQTNVTLLLSIDRTDSRAADGTSTLASVSAGGRYAAFISTATNIADGGTNAAGNLYRRDMISGGRVCGSKNVGALVPGNYRCIQAVLNADGRYAAFVTIGTSNAVFRHDFVADVTTLIFLRDTNTEGQVQISADGRYVAFDDGTNVFRFDANGGTNELISVGSSGTALTSGVARNPVMTPDGNGIAFVSNSSNLTVNGSSVFQIYVRDIVAGITRLVSGATNGLATTTGDETSLIALAPDLSRVAFDSTASDLVIADGNRASDVFVRDLTTGTTQLVSASEPSRPSATGISHSFLGIDALSADGRLVAFSSYDNDLVWGDTNGWVDVFVSDTHSQKTVAPDISTNGAKVSAVSRNGEFVLYTRFTFLSGLGPAPIPAGLFRFDSRTASNELVFAGSGRGPTISADGNLIAFLIFISPNQTLLVRDMARGILQTNAPAVLGAVVGDDRDAAFTPDSRFVLFYSSSGLVTTNSISLPPNLFAHDLITNRAHLVSVSSNQADTGVSGPMSVSANSRHVAFVQRDRRVAVHDLIAETNITYISGLSPSLNADGRFLSFEARDQGQFSNLFGAIVVLDRQTGAIELISMNGSGVVRPGRKPLISGDARFVVFLSSASDLAPDDTNQLNDLFVRDRVLGTTTIISRSINGGSGNAASSAPVMAADGRTVVFHSMASDLVEGDYNDKRDIFILKLGGTDTDSDGLDDDWEVAYFGNLSRNGSADFDADGQTDLQEFRAGTDPTNSNSIFRVLTLTPLGGGSTRVVWNASPGRAYRVEFKDSVADAIWTALDGAISWNGSTASLVDTSAGTAMRYYRVVRLP